MTTFGYKRISNWQPHLEQPNIFALKQLAEDFIGTFAKRANVVSFNNSARTMIVGDLHGDLEATKLVIKLAQEHNCERIVFLGDYVDRGSDQLAVLEYILKLSLANPEVVIPIRGNHEDETMNSKYGFHMELRTKFPTPAVSKEAKGYCLEIYDYMPLAVQTPHSLLLHGGIPENGTLEDIKSIPKPHSKILAMRKPQSQKLQRIFEEVRWNDPSDALSSGFAPSRRGKSVRNFSCKEVEAFLRRSAERPRLFRSHESSRGFFESLWDGLVVHILTSDQNPIISSKSPVPQVGAVAVENEDGSVDILSLERRRIASLPPRRWSRHSVCK
ncbi:MAG: metallophosphoesterase family protein [Candidatus Hodarchaeales archaeon]|jgi:predicted phosphodiesterase